LPEAGFQKVETRIKNPALQTGFLKLSDQGSNLDFLESKSSVLPVTPSDKVTDAQNKLKTLNLGLQR
jgi:hypothetical protein